MRKHWIAMPVLIAQFACGAKPTERELRAAAIRDTAAGISEECGRYANGDWAAWYRQLAPFRAALSEQIATANKNRDAVKADPNALGGALRADGTPPLFDEPNGSGYLVPNDPEKFPATRPAAQVIVAVSRWLKSRNIDLILVPAPKMAEVFSDRLGVPAPPGRIAAPHLRKLLLDLLNADIEVVDLLPPFLAERDSDPEPLYIPDDPHWSDRAQRIAAREIGKRLKRYAFVTSALDGQPLFAVSNTEIHFAGPVLALMNASQRDEIRDYSAHMKLTRISNLQGAPFEEPPQSPVVVIGDSYTHYFQLAISKGTGIDALLSKEINIPVSNVSSAGATTGPIKDFLRNPALLQDRKVVVWIVTNTILSYDSLWEPLKLPESAEPANPKP